MIHTKGLECIIAFRMSEKFKVLVTRNNIPQVALSILEKKCMLDIYEKDGAINRSDLIKKANGKDAIFCLLTDRIDAEVLNSAGSNLKVIGTMSVGYDHLFVEEIKSRGIKIGYTPGVLTDATAELTVALLLATSRRLFEANAQINSGGWTTWGPLWMTGPGLSESTVGIFGLGQVGQAVIKRLKGFNVSKFIYSGRGRKKEGDDVGAEFVSFDALLMESDFLIVTSALTEENKGIFNREAFANMKESAIFINTARGGLVDQGALIEALKSGQICSAGLDVMTPEPIPQDHPLLSAPNLTLLPHIGSAEIRTRVGMAKLTAQNIIAALQGRQMPSELN